MRVLIAAMILLLPGVVPVHDAHAEGFDSLPNNFPHLNPSGFSATFSTQGFIDLTTDYSLPQGTNGRSCQTCHIPQQAWSINPNAIQLLFFLTGGTHPIFNPLDADNPETADFTTVFGRWAAYTTMLTRGVFRRGGAPRADTPAQATEWELIGVDDPNGYACLPGPGCTSATGRIVQWRRVMPTINFHVGSGTVNWDGGNNIPPLPSTTPDQLAGLVNQARRNIDGAQEGDLPPIDSPIVAEIVGFETALSTAQIFSFSAGHLNAGGALGGAEALSLMPKLNGPFTLFDAWTNSPIAARAQIARGQAVFNNVNVPSGRRCGACHSSANNGTSFNNTMFDIETASEAARTPDLPLYTFRNKTTGEIRKLSDTGRGNVTGLWADLGRFKTPTIRALAQRAPYFHNGIAATIEDVVQHYVDFLDFVFTDQEREDLIAFLKAL
jgi:cytochrome c peroxidase